MNKVIKNILVVILLGLLSFDAQSQTLDSLNIVKLDGFIVEVYLKQDRTHKIKEDELFLLKNELVKRKLNLSDIYELERGRDSLIFIAYGEPFNTMNERYFKNSLKPVIYDTIHSDTKVCVKTRKTKKYLYRYYPVIALSSTLKMTESQLIYMIPYDQYHFSSDSTKVYVINRIIPR